MHKHSESYVIWLAYEITEPSWATTEAEKKVVMQDAQFCQILTRAVKEIMLFIWHTQCQLHLV